MKNWTKREVIVHVLEGRRPAMAKDSAGVEGLLTLGGVLEEQQIKRARWNGSLHGF